MKTAPTFRKGSTNAMVWLKDLNNGPFLQLYS